MIIPCGTDAPIYHRPWAAMLLMAVMVGTFIVTHKFGLDVAEPYVLVHGDGIHPIQWVTSHFVEVSIFALIGDLIFLWAFALIVEGKVGFLPFLGIFVGIGAVEAGALQILHLGRDEVDYSFGASGAIYGLMAMALVWAPRNELHCMMLLRFRAILFDMSILWFAILFIALEVLWMVLLGGQLSVALIRVGGAVLGFGLATALLKLNWVDCEKWDLYSVWAGHAGRDKPPVKALKKVKLPVFGEAAESDPMIDGEAGENLYNPRSQGQGKAKAKARKTKTESVPLSSDERADAAAGKMRQAIAEGNAAAALTFHDRARQARSSWRPTDPDWLALIQVLATAKDWANSVTVMEDYLDRAMKPSPRVRLRLAQVLIREQQRPTHALSVLDAIPDGSLAPDLEAARGKLRLQAEQMRDDGVLELDGRAW